jgi:arsenite-transporting ATPase
VIVVDCAPTAETLRLLALPEALGWYIDRVFPTQRRVVKALKPVLTRAAGVPMPHDSVFDAIDRLRWELDEVSSILTGENASVRLVLTPETVVVAEARRSLTTLSLFGYRVDGVVANRVFPEAGADAWRGRWVAAQAQALGEVAHSFAELPIWRSAYQGSEPVGIEQLASFASEAYGEDDPLAIPSGEAPMSVRRTANGTTLSIVLPFVGKTDVDLARHGDELVVTVGSYRRLLALPTSLRKQAVAGAGMESGALQIRFRTPVEEPV